MSRKLLLITVLVVVMLAILSCSGTKAVKTSAAVPDISGSWEAIATSNANSSIRIGIEVALKEGQTLVNGVQQPNGQVSASGPSQINFVTLDATTMNIQGFGGTCPGVSGSANDLAGTVTDLGGTFNFTFHEAGNLFNVTAVLGADGQSFLGTYASAQGSACSDGGAISGIRVPKIAGTFSGQLTMPDSLVSSVAATVSQNSSGLNVGLVVSSPTSYSLTLTGPVTGNVFTVQGTVQGQGVSYLGYYEQIFDPNLLVNVPSIYFANATDPAHPVYAGTLAIPVQ